MTIPDKYNVPKASWVAMVKDGIITSKVARAGDIISCYNQKKAAGLTNFQAVQSTSIEMHCSDRWVYEVLARYC